MDKVSVHNNELINHQSYNVYTTPCMTTKGPKEVKLNFKLITEHFYVAEIVFFNWNCLTGHFLPQVLYRSYKLLSQGWSFHLCRHRQYYAHHLLWHMASDSLIGIGAFTGNFSFYIAIILFLITVYRHISNFFEFI